MFRARLKRREQSHDHCMMQHVVDTLLLKQILNALGLPCSYAFAASLKRIFSGRIATVHPPHGRKLARTQQSDDAQVAWFPRILAHLHTGRGFSAETASLRRQAQSLDGPCAEGGSAATTVLNFTPVGRLNGENSQ